MRPLHVLYTEILVLFLVNEKNYFSSKGICDTIGGSYLNTNEKNICWNISENKNQHQKKTQNFIFIHILKIHLIGGLLMKNNKEFYF